jgi:hypothetical protein
MSHIAVSCQPGGAESDMSFVGKANTNSIVNVLHKTADWFNGKKLNKKKKLRTKASINSDQ